MLLNIGTKCRLWYHRILHFQYTFSGGSVAGTGIAFEWHKILCSDSFVFCLIFPPVLSLAHYWWASLIPWASEPHTCPSSSVDLHRLYPLSKPPFAAEKVSPKLCVHFTLSNLCPVNLLCKTDCIFISVHLHFVSSILFLAQHIIYITMIW